MAKGKPALLILDADKGGKQSEISFPTLGEIYTPSFSPDGRSVVFSALVDGFTDLFTYDFQAEKLRRLTDDPSRTCSRRGRRTAGRSPL